MPQHPRVDRDELLELDHFDFFVSHLNLCLHLGRLYYPEIAEQVKVARTKRSLDQAYAALQDALVSVSSCLGWREALTTIKADNAVSVVYGCTARSVQ